MKKLLSVISLIFLIYLPGIFSQTVNNTEVYLLTCAPGTETYSIYGHSALRIVDREKHSDIVYNWGVFNTNTTNFAWKFAKGRLEYALGVDDSIPWFLEQYVYEQRYVHSQKINLDPDETNKLIALIQENLKPENVRYRYDFFYDDCSTRIRDLLEKSIGEKLLYPPSEATEISTFREMVAKYQSPFPWLQFGIDLIMGSPADKKATFRDRMFLPLDMQTGFSATVIKRSGKMIPLVQNTDVIVDFEPLVIPQKFITTPLSVFALLLIVIIILSGWLKSRKIFTIIDIFIFSVFSILALLMIFFNFFTDHQQMKWNLNILWLNPLVLMCLISLVLKKTTSVWFRIVFFISATFLVIHLFLPQEFNRAILPLVLIIMVRSSVRAGFSWNPLTLK